MRWLLALALLARVAHAEPAVVLAALAPAPDVREAVAIGPDGEVYAPDGHGAWARRAGVAIAGHVTGATQTGSEPIAITHDGPPFRLARDGWTVIQLGMHVKPIVGAGPRAVAAVGRAVFALDKPEPTKLPDAPAPVVAIAASAGGVVVETERGLARLDRTAWKPLDKAPRHVAALLSDRLAIVDRGLYDLRANKMIAWPAGVRVALAIATGDDSAIAVAQKGAALELVTVKAGKLASEALPAEAAGPVVGLAGDRAGRAVVALRDGRLAIRDKGTWSTVRVRDEAPSAHPGPPPATSR